VDPLPATVAGSSPGAPVSESKIVVPQAPVQTPAASLSSDDATSSASNVRPLPGYGLSAPLKPLSGVSFVPAKQDAEQESSLPSAFGSIGAKDSDEEDLSHPRAVGA